MVDEGLHWIEYNSTCRDTIHTSISHSYSIFYGPFKWITLITLALCLPFISENTRITCLIKLPTDVKLAMWWELRQLWQLQCICPIFFLHEATLNRKRMPFPIWLPFLTHRDRVTHICVCKLGPLCFIQWLVTCSVPSHILTQCLRTVIWNAKNKLQWKFSQSTKLFIQRSAFSKGICRLAAVLSRTHHMLMKQYGAIIKFLLSGAYFTYAIN